MIKRLDKEEIEALLNKRSVLLDEDYNDPVADAIQKAITESIKAHFDSYQCDYIIETLTKFVQAPNLVHGLVYDDNGQFALSSTGYQPVVTGEEKMEGETMIFVMEKEMWKPTIREAIWHYLEQL